MINTIISAVTGAYIAEIALIAACAAIVAGVLIAYFVRRKRAKPVAADVAAAAADAATANTIKVPIDDLLVAICINSLNMKIPDCIGVRNFHCVY